MTICVCRSVSTSDLKSALTKGASDISDVKKMTKACTGCTWCEDKICSLIRRNDERGNIKDN